MSALHDQLLDALAAAVEDAERRAQATRVIDAVCGALDSAEVSEAAIAAAAAASFGDAVTRADEAVAAAERSLRGVAR
jgi:hypothetical protein